MLPVRGTVARVQRTIARVGRACKSWLSSLPISIFRRVSDLSRGSNAGCYKVLNFNLCSVFLADKSKVPWGSTDNIGRMLLDDVDEAIRQVTVDPYTNRYLYWNSGYEFIARYFRYNSEDTDLFADLTELIDEKSRLRILGPDMEAMAFTVPYPDLDYDSDGEEHGSFLLCMLCSTRRPTDINVPTQNDTSDLVPEADLNAGAQLFRCYGARVAPLGRNWWIKKGLVTFVGHGHVWALWYDGKRFSYAIPVDS